MGAATGATTEVGRLVRGLYFVAMGVFLVTIVIGILNGLDVVTFNRDQILTHVHSGTIGWISVGIVAAYFWLTRRANAAIGWSLAVLVPIYVAAFYTGNYAFRAIAGTPLLIVIVWLFVWAWRAARAVGSFPAYAVALALTTFAYGAVFGVVLQIGFATSTTLLPGDGIGAHAATMTTSYLMLAGMGLTEWRLLRTRTVPRSGLVQIGFLFLGGVILAAALLFSIDLKIAGGLNILCEFVAVAIFIARVWPTALRAPWRAADGRRHIALAALVIPFSMAILIYLIVLAASSSNPNAIPTGLLIAFDHSVFIGVITNTTFGLIFALTQDRPPEASWLRHVVFVGMNLGLLVFLVGLVADSATIKEIGSPIMGLSILLGLAILARRLLASDVEAASEMDPATEAQPAIA
jgi:hypothetical protein